MRKVRDDIEGLKQIAGAIVKKLEPVCGSRMLAYEEIATAIGLSASWVRKFITVDGTPEPRWSVGCALRRYYEDVCDELDRKADLERDQITEIMGRLHEADPVARAIPIPSFLPDRPGG